jgi:hypothetical protein
MYQLLTTHSPFFSPTFTLYSFLLLSLVLSHKIIGRYVQHLRRERLLADIWDCGLPHGYGLLLALLCMIYDFTQSSSTSLGIFKPKSSMYNLCLFYLPLPLQPASASTSRASFLHLSIAFTHITSFPLFLPPSSVHRMLLVTENRQLRHFGSNDEFEDCINRTTLRKN